jgi:hypothetical protein
MNESLMSPDVLTDEALARIVDENLPKWKIACLHADASCVILSQRAFTNSENDLFFSGGRHQICWNREKGRGHLMEVDSST